MFCAGYNFESVRVLFVDNRADDCELYRIVFSDCGADITIVNSAHDALAAFDELDPHVVVSDISLPDEDGYELIKRLRERGTSIPAVAVSGFAYEHDRRKTLEAGFTAYLPKPVEPQTLVRTVAELLGLPTVPSPDRH